MFNIDLATAVLLVIVVGLVVLLFRSLFRQR
jgi:hypothetical protein